MTSGNSCGPTETLIDPSPRASDGPLYCPKSGIMHGKVKTLVALLLLPAAALAQTNGALFVHLRGGYHVLVDGTDTGTTTDDVGGKVTPIAPGKHHITVRSPEGREAQFDVAIAAGMTTDITLSPLGFRKPVPATDEPGALHVVCVPEDCSVMFRDKDKMTND